MILIMNRFIPKITIRRLSGEFLSTFQGKTLLQEDSASAVQVEKEIDSSHNDFDNESMDTQDHDKNGCEVFQLQSYYIESADKQLQLDSAFHLEDIFLPKNRNLRNWRLSKATMDQKNRLCWL